jgi:hypothetical protein
MSTIFLTLQYLDSVIVEEMYVKVGLDGIRTNANPELVL